MHVHQTHDDIQKDFHLKISPPVSWYPYFLWSGVALLLARPLYRKVGPEFESWPWGDSSLSNSDEDTVKAEVLRIMKHALPVRNHTRDLMMELLDINLIKDSSLFLHAIHNPFYWWILEKTILFSGFKNSYKNPRNKKTPVYSWIAFCRREKGG